MKKLYIISLLVCSLLILSCTSETDVKDSNANDPINNQTEEQQIIETTVEEIIPDLPERNFNGAEIQFLVRDDGGGQWQVVDIYAESENGDNVNDAIFRRNKLIEEKYSVSIKETTLPVGSIASTINKIVKAGEETYHGVICNAEEKFPMAFNNLILDLNELTYIDLNKPWWDASLNSDTSILKKQYYAAGALNIMAYEATWIGMFNKQMLQDSGYNSTDIYNMVKNGTWTISKYEELTRNFIRDLNNDGKMNHEDQYGTAGQSTMVMGFFVGGGLRFVEKDENDGLIFRDFNEHTSNLLEMLAGFLNNKVAFNSHDTGMNGSGIGEYGRDLLAANRSLFFTETLGCVRVMRDMASDFGVVPMPKYDENQEKYISMVHYWATSLTSVPINCPDREMTGIILEEMAYQTQRTVLPEYFNVAINGKYLRDEESIEMIDYIMENRSMDLGISNNYAGLPWALQDSIYRDNVAFASIYERSKNTIISELERTMDKVNQ